ncbi:uncharacterized protein LOC143580218 [Bidens hawaiensis]|uniref:uncharacterized protein LOC143580218 n=1 Tax=Bidens hawaiensis TaxID=980011 RepID=UPI00404913A6
MVMVKSRITSKRLSNAYDEGVEAFLEFAQSNNPNSDSDEQTESDSGPTVKRKANRGKIVITYNKKGVPIGEGATKLATFEGMTARTMIPITYECWLDVPKETKEDAWKFVLKFFVVDPNSRKQSIQSIGTKWRNFKHNLYKIFIEPHKNNPKALVDPPATYKFLKKEDWKLFVAQRLSKKWQDKSKKAKGVRARHKYNHRLSRKGYAGLTIDIMQQTGKKEEEIDRAVLWKEARKLKTGGFDKNVQEIVDKIDGLHNSGFYESCATHDVLTEALGTKEQRGHVRGMGKFVTPHQYPLVPKTIKKYLDIEQKKTDERFSKLEDELEKLKSGMHNVSEAASYQMVGHEEDFEDEPHDLESPDKSCLLAVDDASNIVATGAIMDHSASGDENIEVVVEICVQGEALVPIPIEEELIEKVKDAVGFILRWPRHLVIRCSDLKKVVARPMRKNAKRLRELDEENEKENEKQKKQPSKPVKENANEKGKEKETRKEILNEQETRKEKVNEKRMLKRRMTRANRKPRIRIEKRPVLKMTAMMVDTHASEVDYVKVQCEDELFGYNSCVCITWDDFEAIFTLDEMSGAVITSYMMYLFEQIKNGSRRDHGICFVSPTATSLSTRKSKSKNIDDSSRNIADRLFKRKDNDIILIPYNPGRHWVLAVLHMKTTTCYYLDSLRPSSVNLQLRQIIDAAMDLYGTQSGSRVKLNWVNARCPCQPGSIECGYYMLKFMQEIVNEGIELLLNDNVGVGKDQYTDADIDGIREEWSSFVTPFIFQ